MKPSSLLTATLFLITGHLVAQTVTDIDGNVYATVTIGDQVWMAENLRTTRFNDGSGIPMVPDSNAWSSSTFPAYCWYSNTALYREVLGGLYNGFAAASGKLAPEGWHVPSDEEWTRLTDYLGGAATAGGKLKAKETVNLGTGYWYTPNTGATNQSGFSAYGGGARELNGDFNYLFTDGYWWTSTRQGEGMTLYRHMTYLYADVERGAIKSQNGFSVRCVRDTGPGIGRTEPELPFRIFPNPVHDILEISCKENLVFQLQIFDLAENQVANINVYGPGTHIGLATLPPGLYFFTATVDNRQFRGKFAKE